MKCIWCESLCLRILPPDTVPNRLQLKSGWAKCLADSAPGQPMMIIFNRDRNCGKFKQAPDDIVEARIEWSKKL